jgi:hypothetical protein
MKRVAPSKAWVRRPPSALWTRPPSVPPAPVVATDRLEECRQAWEQHGHGGALHEALARCIQGGQPLPDWVARPVLARLQADALTPTRKNELDHYWRACLVDDARVHGLTFADAYACAAERLHVSEGTVRRSYWRVRRRQRGAHPMVLWRADEVYLDRYRKVTDAAVAAVYAKYTARRPALDFVDDGRARL